MDFCQTWERKSQQISKNCFHPDDVIATRIGGNELIVKAKFVFEKWKFVRDPIWLFFLFANNIFCYYNQLDSSM